MEACILRYLSLFFILGFLIPKFQAECYWHTEDVCQHGEHKYKVGEMWKTEDCYQCSCITTTKVICCNMVNYTVDLRQPCKVWYDSTTCQLSLLCGRYRKQQLKRSKKSITFSRNILNSIQSH